MSAKAVCELCGWTMDCEDEQDADDMLQLHLSRRMNLMLSENLPHPAPEDMERLAKLKDGTE